MSSKRYVLQRGHCFTTSPFLPSSRAPSQSQTFRGNQATGPHLSCAQNARILTTPWHRDHISPLKPRAWLGKTLNGPKGSGAPQARFRPHLAMHFEHPSRFVDEEDVEVAAHCKRVHIAASRKHHYPAIRKTSRQAAQAPPRTARHAPGAPKRRPSPVLYAPDT